jgi:hypothetical protein
VTTGEAKGTIEGSSLRGGIDAIFVSIGQKMAQLSTHLWWWRPSCPTGDGFDPIIFIIFNALYDILDVAYQSIFDRSCAAPAR